MATGGSAGADASEDRYGEYRVRRLLGRGGMGAVYEAEHVEHGNVVALKVIDRVCGDESLANRRFLREARIPQLVRHPNVVSMLEVGFERGRPFLVMELLEGETLGAYLAREGPLPAMKVVELFAPVTAAVAAIHAARVLHRDLKLSNVLLAQRCGVTEPVVLDFGISKAVEDDMEDGSLTRSGGVLGTPSYLSPEQTLNAKAASPRSDEYALGVMLYECLTGERPFAGDSPYEIMHAILNAPLRRPSEHRADLPAELDAVVLRALSRDPTARFGSVRALGSALLRFGSEAVQTRWSAELASPARESLEGEHTEIDLRNPLSPPRPAAAASLPPPSGRRAAPRLTLRVLALAALGTTAFAALAQVPNEKPALPPATPQPKAPALATTPTVETAPTPEQARSVPHEKPAAAAPPASSVAKPIRRRGHDRQTAPPLVQAERQLSLSSAPRPGRDEALDPFDVP